MVALFLHVRKGFFPFLRPLHGHILNPFLEVFQTVLRIDRRGIDIRVSHDLCESDQISRIGCEIGICERMAETVGVDGNR